LAGSIAIAFFNRRDRARVFIYVGSIGLCLAEIVFALSRIYVLSCALLIVVGISQTIFTTTANTRVLSLTPNRLQGRVMSVYSLMFLGMTPFGSFLSGVVAQRWGASAPLIWGASITLVITLVIFALRRRQRERLETTGAAG
jgi:predicted MFS family arabinose efflux permease